jgi:co-chaperonin GroES (HSP10)
MKFNPLADRILIKPTPPDNFRGGLEIQGEPKAEGTVIAIGKGVPLHNITLNVTGEVTPEAMSHLAEVVSLIEKGRAMNVKVGDYVMYGKYAGTKVMHNDEEHIIIREADVFGDLTEE